VDLGIERAVRANALAINDKLKNAFGAAAVANVTTQSHTVDGKDMCRVDVRPSGFPFDAKELRR